MACQKNSLLLCAAAKRLQLILKTKTILSVMRDFVLAPLFQFLIFPKTHLACLHQPLHRPASHKSIVIGESVTREINEKICSSADNYRRSRWRVGGIYEHLNGRDATGKD